MKILSHYSTLFNLRYPQITEIVPFPSSFIALFLLSIFAISIHAQVPQAINYQAVCRDTNGTPLAQQVVTYRASVLQGSPSGTVMYRETHTDTTNVYGISTLKIGRGTPVQGTFASIAWGSGSYYLSIEMDPAGGSNYRNLGAPELLSVPYAMQSKDGIVKGTITNQLLYWNGTVWDTLNPGSSGQMLTMCNGNLIWGNCPGALTSLSCSTATHNGTLISGVATTGVSSRLPYSGGNGGLYPPQSYASTGVTGLTASITSGILVSGNDSLTINILGTPSTSGTASFSVSIGGQSCTLTRTVNAGLITGLACSTSVNIGNLVQGEVALGVNNTISYIGGNGGSHNGQIVSSTGVTGLTATLSSGNFANGNGSLSYSITGTPATSGTALFPINIGGLNCTLSRTVLAIGSWRPGMVHCSSPTQVASITNPTTNKTWMDRNLGASQAATSTNNAASYGDLYQWGRFADGHQCRNSGTTSTLSNADTTGNGLFITAVGDWRATQNDILWQGTNGVNNPCPVGFRLPTDAELDAERLSWSSNDHLGAFASPLKLPSAGLRNHSTGVLGGVGLEGMYASSSFLGDGARHLYFNSGGATIYTNARGFGFSVRCLQDCNGQCPGTLTSLSCSTATHYGNLTSGASASGVSSSIPYTGGNGGPHNGQTVASSGVTGLTATLSAGSFVNGNGSLSYTITGTPATSGTASFAISIGGQSCAFTVTINPAIGSWRPGMVHCGTPTQVVPITNPTTNKTWMDRNLGASQVATTTNDTNAYGDSYQWGRFGDGHQCRNSGTTANLSSTDTPGNSNFILNNVGPNDWRGGSNNNLWQGLNGINNPCPIGYRLPSESELNSERLSWMNNNITGAFNSQLRLVTGGMRTCTNGILTVVGIAGYYWTSTVSSGSSRYLTVGSSYANWSTFSRGNGCSVRCIQD